jgi:hypothetical protein
MDKNPLVDRKVSLRKLGDEESFDLGTLSSRPESDVDGGVSAISTASIPRPPLEKWTFKHLKFFQFLYK